MSKDKEATAPAKEDVEQKPVHIVGSFKPSALDYFTAAALTGFVFRGGDADKFASQAVRVAEQVISELKKRESK
jgi:hypothetical protein